MILVVATALGSAVRHFAAALLTAGLARAEVDLPPLLAPAELVTVIGEHAPLILDIRAPGAAGEAGTYAAGKIAGSVNAPYAPSSWT